MSMLVASTYNSDTKAEVFGDGSFIKITKKLYFGSDGPAAIKQAFGVYPQLNSDFCSETKEKKRITRAFSVGGAWRETFCLTNDQMENDITKRWSNSNNLVNRIISYKEWHEVMMEKYICERYYNNDGDVCVLWEWTNEEAYRIILAMGSNGKMMKYIPGDVKGQYSITVEYLI